MTIEWTFPTTIRFRDSQWRFLEQSIEFARKQGLAQVSNSLCQCILVWQEEDGKIIAGPKELPTKERIEQSVERNRNTWGPKLWKEIHETALSDIDQASWVRYMQGIRHRLPCGECKRHWIKITDENPLDAVESKFRFRYTVDRHNDVNLFKNKPVLAESEARSLY